MSNLYCLPGRAGGSPGYASGALRNGDHSDRADVRFARPNIQIYDAHAVDLYQWVCARYSRPKKWVLAERVSVNPPLKDKVFSTFLDQNPPFELRPENGVSP